MLEELFCAAVVAIVIVVSVILLSNYDFWEVSAPSVIFWARSFAYSTSGLCNYEFYTCFC